jgi:hypothetical protein
MFLQALLWLFGLCRRSVTMNKCMDQFHPKLLRLLFRFRRYTIHSHAIALP